jgi:hypothetical protein
MEKIKSHTGFRNEKLFCFNCGVSHDLGLPQPVKQMTDMMKAFERLHKNCKPVWTEPEPPASESETQKVSWWLKNGEQGLSSKTIYSVITGQNIMGGWNYHHPSDPDDFRRCYLLLKAIPEWREKLDKMRSVSEVWNKLVDNWDKLTGMLETAMKSKTGKAPRMYEFMKSIGC